MKISKLIRTAMANKGVKNATELSKLSGVQYSAVIRALNDGNISVNLVIEMLDCLGYQLSIALKGGA